MKIPAFVIMYKAYSLNGEYDCAKCIEFNYDDAVRTRDLLNKEHICEKYFIVERKLTLD